MTLPHGSKDLSTSRLQMTVPSGIQAIKPEELPGWTITVHTQKITPYLSHGKMISTAPSTIVWQADSVEDILHNDHLMVIHFQIKLGCDYNSSSTLNSQWQDEFTLWWPIV